MFVDKAAITIKAGRGGDGAVSFHREKYVAAGGPDGGDGGRGGNVVFAADTNVNSLLSYRYKKRYFAQNGEPGKAKRCSGKNAPELVLRVPKGTVVREAATGRVLADVSGDEPVIVARGGSGGWGNTHFATATRQIPRFAKPGLDGESFEVILELKLLADVGLAGFPNVGKSTLISAVSDARPEIANYHFTTLTPVLGVVRVSDERAFVMADIPGLIEGASEGAGLGHEFLRHIDRCRLIVHVVDVSGCEGRDPVEDYKIISRELSRFSPQLGSRPSLVAANKCDAATPEQIAAFRTAMEARGLRVFEISAVTGAGTRELVYALSQELDKLPPIMEYEPEPAPEQAEGPGYEVVVEDGVYHLRGPRLRRMFGMIDVQDEESMRYFQRMLESSGILAALVAAGINEGDTVEILNYEFEYSR